MKALPFERLRMLPVVRALAILTMLACVACRAATAPSEPSDVPLTELAAPGRALPSAGGAPGDPAEPAPPGGAATEPAATGTAEPPARPRTVGRATDPSGDAGLGAPAYADIRSVTLLEHGGTARATVVLGPGLRDPMPAGEQLAIGVDLYAEDAAESDFQLYATGTEDGWLAYLQTPRGFVQYPGAFYVGTDRVLFEVPWSALADLRGSRFSGFSDWDAQGTVVNRVAADRVPDDGRARWAR